MGGWAKGGFYRLRRKLFADGKQWGNPVAFVWRTRNAANPQSCSILLQGTVSGAMRTCAPRGLVHRYKEHESAILNTKGRLTVLWQSNMEESLGNYLRTHRKKAGLSQRELGRLIGYGNEGQVPRHEFSRSLPPLLIAVGYEIVFRERASAIFPGLYEVVEQAVERNIAELEETLRQHSGKGSRAAATAHKLGWLHERRSHRYSLR